LLTAFIAAIVAVVILVAAVLSTVATAEIVTRELDALAAFAGQLAGDVEGWPQAAVDAGTRPRPAPAAPRRRGGRRGLRGRLPRPGLLPGARRRQRRADPVPRGPLGGVRADPRRRHPHRRGGRRAPPRGRRA